MLVLPTNLKWTFCSLQNDYHTHPRAVYSSPDIINLIFQKSVGQKKKVQFLGPSQVRHKILDKNFSQPRSVKVKFALEQAMKAQTGE